MSHYPSRCLIGTLAFVFLCLLPQFVRAQCGSVSGRVFTDFNENGAYDAATERGVSDLVVAAFDNNNVLINSALTGADGTYAIDVTGAAAVACPDGGFCYRVSFTLPDDYRAWSADAGGGGAVQRVCAPGCTADLAAYRVVDYCEGAPKLTTSCFLQGNNTGAGDVLISFDFNNPTAVEHEAVENQIATIYGIAYQTQSDNLFAGAFEKRFSGYGAGGPGTIYLVDSPKDGLTSGTPFVDLNNLFGSGTAGTDQHDFTALAGDGSPIDALSFNLVGRQALGDLELSDDELTLYTINLADRSLYAIPLGGDPTNPTAPTAAAQIDVVPLADAGNPLPDLPAGISNEELIPFDLDVHRGQVYIGMVSNGQTNGLGAMYGMVYRYNPTDASFAKVLQFPLDYARGCAFGSSTTCFGAADWQPWINTNVFPTPVFDAFNEVGYPQPILADLDFDVNENLVISLRDRWGDQGSYASPKPDNDDTYKHFDSFGDILYATTTDGQSWSLDIADFTDNTLSTGTAPGGAEAACPDGETFFVADCYNADTYIHEETAYSGIAVHLASNQVAGIAMDPFVQAYSTGIDWFDLTTGNRTSYFQILNGATGGGGFAKGNGLGDLELLCAPAPLEIGNYVWLDTDADDLQDPCEPPIAGATVTLYDATDTEVGTAVTDSEGRYYFGGVTEVGMTGGNSLQPNTAYSLRMDLAATETVMETAGLSTGTLLVSLTDAADDAIDNDAALVGGTTARIDLTTGGAGDHQHAYDFGFYDCPDLSAPSPSAALCSGVPLVSLSVTTTGDSVRFVYFGSAQSDAGAYTGGTPLGIVAAPAGSASLTDVVFPDNNGSADEQYFIYALVYPTPALAACRPVELTQITVHPEVNTGVSSAAVCRGATVQVDGLPTGGFDGYTAHQWTDLGTGTATGYALSGATTVQLTVDATAGAVFPGTVELAYQVTDSNSCTAADTVTVTIHPIPAALPTEVYGCRETGSATDYNYALTSIDAEVLNGAAGTVIYYSDAAATTSIADPGSYVTAADTVYAKVQINGCESPDAAAVTLGRTAVSVAIAERYCATNSTPGDENDDYFLVDLLATTNDPSGGNYEVVLNAAPDGSGGSVIDTQVFGDMLIVGQGGELQADDTSNYVLTVRAAGAVGCFNTVITGIVDECSEYRSSVCVPHKITRLSQ